MTDHAPGPDPRRSRPAPAAMRPRPRSRRPISGATRRTLASAALVALLALASPVPAAPQDDFDFVIEVPPPVPEPPAPPTTTPAAPSPPPAPNPPFDPPAPPSPPPRPAPPPPPRPPPQPPEPPLPPTPANWNVDAPRRDANGDFCVMAFESRAAGTSASRYGSAEPNAFPEAVFADERDFAPAQALDAAAVSYVDAHPRDPRAKLLAGCPSRTALCVSSGYGGEFVWEDTLTSDQSVFQENQNPTLHVAAAVFPAQPEGFPDARGWNGAGWFSDEGHEVETEVAQGMELFDTDLYRLVFKNGHVLLGPGATCSEARRANLACPDRYFANGTLADNYEEIQRVNVSATFDGRPPLRRIGSYPPGRWGHVRISAGMAVPKEEPEKMGKLFVVAVDARFQGATPSTGTTRTYVRLTDRIGPVRVHHRGTQRRLFSPPPAPPFAPGYRFPPNPPEPPAPPEPPSPPPSPPPAPPYYPPVPPEFDQDYADARYVWPPPPPPPSPPSPPPAPSPPPSPPPPPPPNWETFAFHPPACVDSLRVSFTRAVARAAADAAAPGGNVSATPATAWEEVVLSSRRFEDANVSIDLGLSAYEADPGMGHAKLENVSRVSTTVPPETCDNPFVTHRWFLTRAPNATVPVPYTPWVDPLAPPAPEVDLDAIDESIPEWMRKYDFPPPPPSPPPPPPPPDLDASDAAAWRRDFAAGAQIAEGSKLTFVPDGPGEYVVRVDAVGSCVGQVASSEASLRVDCNRAPVPDAVVFEEDDVVLALETPRHDDDDDAMLAPPNANKTDFLVSGGAFSGAFSALDAGARVATYRPTSPRVARCFKKTVLDGSASRDPEEGRPWRGGDAFVTAWSIVSAPPASALRGARWTGGARASFAQVGVAATLRPDREGRYVCVAETYDGCAEASAKTFFVDVEWDDACLTKSRDAALYLAAPLAAAVLCVFARALGGAEPEDAAEGDTPDDDGGRRARRAKRRPPLRWTHPSQVALDALACLASREAAARRARAVAESAADGPRLKHQASVDADRRKARRDRRRAGLIATAFRGDVPAARAKRARALRARRGDASDSASDESDDSETEGVPGAGSPIASKAPSTPKMSSAEEEAFEGDTGSSFRARDLADTQLVSERELEPVPVPPDFDDDSLWDDKTGTEDAGGRFFDDSATLASPASTGAPGPVVEAFEGVTARIKALLGVREQRETAEQLEEKARKAKKALRKKRREEEKKKLAARRARALFLNRVRRVFGFADAEVPSPPQSPARGDGDSSSDDSETRAAREPRNARERRARETLAPRATTRERLDAARTLARDAFSAAADSASQVPRRAYWNAHVSCVAAKTYLFDVPGGANALLLRSFLVLEFPTLMGVFFRNEAPPFARGGDAGARLAAALTPGWALGANAHVAATYLQLVAAFVASCVAVAGPGCGRVCAAVAARAWHRTWVAADVVEAGGVAGGGEASAAARRAERTRRCGTAIPRDLWRAAKDAKVFRALEEHLEEHAETARGGSALEPEEDDRMDAWCRRGLRARREAVRFETVARRFAAAGAACRLALGTFAFFPAVHASLATLVPMAGDHARPYAYAGFDPAVFYGSAGHLALAAVGAATCASAFACAAFGAAELSAAVPALRVQPSFEVPCFLLKLAIAAVSAVWEARLGKEPVAAARDGAVALAWAHDGFATAACLVLAAAHVATQSLRGDARAWNDWRAASLGGCAWTGLVTLAARRFGGFGPVRAFAFLRDEGVRLATAGSSSPSDEDVAFWRAFLGLSLPCVMALCAYLNGAAFGHVSLPTHLVRPDDSPSADHAPDRNARGKRRRRADAAGAGDVEAGFGFRSGFGPARGGVESESESDRRGKTGSRLVTVALRVARLAETAARGVDRALPFAESRAARAAREARARDPNAAAEARRRRDRVVSWMCDFRRLDAKRVARDDRVVTIARGFAVTDERLYDKTQRRDAVHAAEELFTLAVVATAAPKTFAARGGDALPRAAFDAAARGVGAAVAGGDRYCSTLAWRAVRLFEEALRSEVPAVRAAAASALAAKDKDSGRNDFADACAALLFRRHDVGVKRPSFFNLRRWWDVALAEPEYRAACAAEETGLPRAKKLDAAWRGAYLTPWPAIARARARAFLETDEGGVETGSWRDGGGDERTHLFLKALDPTGSVLGGTPLAEAGLDAADAEAASVKELRTKLRRDEARRARRARAAQTGTRTEADAGSDASDASLSDDESIDNPFDLLDGSDEALAQSHYAPDVAARRRAERHERRDAKAHGVPAAARAVAALRRVAPARRSYREPPAGSLRQFFLSFGASARLRDARARHDALRITLANRTLASLLDAALGGEGDEVSAANAAAAAPEAASSPRKDPTPKTFRSRSETAGAPALVPALTTRGLARLFFGSVLETPARAKPGALPPAGAAAAMAAAAALALGDGGVPAFLKTDYGDGTEIPKTPPSRTYLAAALRACGGVDRPPLVASRASDFVNRLVKRRRTRGALLRRLAAVMADAAAAPTDGRDLPRASPVSSRRARRARWAPAEKRVDEDARVTICVRALGLARRAAELARRDRAVAAQLSILAARANLRGDRDALDGDAAATKGIADKGNRRTRERTRVMFLKLRARAACDAARRTDRDSLVRASRGAVRLLNDASPDVRVAAAGALKALATVLVAAEASFAAVAVASRVGECHADRGDGDVPAGRWSVPRDDWEQGLGEGDDDMAPESDAVAEAAAAEAVETVKTEKKKKKAPKRSRHADSEDAPGERTRNANDGVASSNEATKTTERLSDETRDPETGIRARNERRASEDSMSASLIVTPTRASVATDPLDGAFLSPEASRRFDSARLVVSLDRVGHQDTHPGARDALFAACEAVTAARARARAAARRAATGGVLGAHVAAWAALTADASLPGVADDAVRLKFEALVRPTRRRVAEARRLSRQEADSAAAGDVDVEAARVLASEARAATEEALAAYGLLDAPNGFAERGGRDATEETTEAFRPTDPAAVSVAAVAVETSAFRGSPSDRVAAKPIFEPTSESAVSSAVAAKPAAKPKSPTRVTSPVRVAAPPDEAHFAYLARVKAQARRGAETTDAPLTAGELVRTTGPTRQTMTAVRVMLGRSVAKQHEKNEHAARARVANRWREAREKDAGRAAEENVPHHLRRGGTSRLAKTNAENVAPSTSAPSRAPVDLASLRAARRNAPPGGDMQLSRPTGSRPVLERARAADTFRRVADARPPDAVAARRAKQAAENAAKAAKKAAISKRYYGTETFRKPVVKKNLDADGPRVVKDSSGRTWMM